MPVGPKPAIQVALNLPEPECDGKVPFHNHNQVARPHLVAAAPEPLPNEPFDPVAPDRVSDLASNGDSQPGSTSVSPV